MEHPRVRPNEGRVWGVCWVGVWVVGPNMRLADAHEVGWFASIQLWWLNHHPRHLAAPLETGNAMTKSYRIRKSWSRTGMHRQLFFATSVGVCKNGRHQDLD